MRKGYALLIISDSVETNKSSLANRSSFGKVALN